MQLEGISHSVFQKCFQQFPLYSLTLGCKSDVEQIAHTFLEQQRHRKLQCNIKGEVLVEAIGVTVLELHEIWQVEGKRCLIQIHYCHECRHNLGEFLH